MDSKHEVGVVLPEGQTGSTFFYNVLAETARDYASSFSGIEMPATAGSFKSSYGDALARFELARLGSPDRVEIARTILTKTQDALCYSDGTQRQALSAFLGKDGEPPVLSKSAFSGTPSLTVEVPFEGRTYRGEEVMELAELLHSRHHVTDAVPHALRWLLNFERGHGGRIDLSGQRFAIMGAGAELAPTRLLQKAGATVLWIDVAEPKVPQGAEAETWAGSRVTVQGASDLLKRPDAVAAAIRAFAAEGPVHVGMFAYAAGASQEWRLAASMNAIVRSLPAEIVASVAMFVSPTTVPQAYPETQEAMAGRRANRPLWQRLLQATGALATPGHLRADGIGVCRAVVSVQGVSYQAAQYVSKLLAAEVYANYGTNPGTHSPVTVSANVAGITRTRSLSHPVFQAAFAGAPAFDVQIFDPDTTRTLSGLLMLHDILNPDALGAKSRSFDTTKEKADAVLSQQVHGGVYVLPFALESAIRVAALLGMAKDPRVLFSKKKPRART